MTITSLGFMLFVAMAALVAYRLPGRAQGLWLLLVSYVFVASWAWQFALVLLSVTSLTYWLAGRIASSARGRTWLWLGLATNIGALAFFKSTAFFWPDLVMLLGRWGLPIPGDGVRLAVPLGLSFYSLQSMSYLVDVHRRQVQPVTDAIDFGLYMAWFPKFLAGPIERVRGFVPQLAEVRVVDNAALASAGTLIVVGLFRKLVLADPLAALIPDEAFFVPGRFSAPQLWSFVLAYGFFLYNDFAGYTSIVRGVSRLFGLELSPNFNIPYFSRTFGEFWNRWHISLSHWLRDYVYMPLARGLLRRRPQPKHWLNVVAPPMVTMFVSALWHATIDHKTVLLWGLLHGIYQVGERLRTLGRPLRPPDTWPRRTQLLSGLVCFILVMLAWVPFREGSQLGTTLATWLGMFRLTDLAPPDPRIFLILLPAVALDVVQYRGGSELVSLQWRRPVQSAALACAVLLIAFALMSEPGRGFVYQGF